MEKIILDKDIVKALCNNDVEVMAHNKMFGLQQQSAKVFIRNMIANDIPLRVLVSGFRGTGKSCFVNYVFDKELSKNRKKRKAEEDSIEKLVVVRFNTAKYTEYKYFLRKIIRELYLATKDAGYLENNNASLERLYLSTFYDVKEVSEEILSNTRTDALEKYLEKSNEGQFKLEDFVDIAFIIGFVRDFHLRLVALFLIIISKFTLKVQAGRNLRQSLEAKKQNSLSLKKETLYDDEIAEYLLFDELEKLKKQKVKVVFLIDELDKLDEETSAKIVKDIKPLILNENSNSILVAGVNFEKQILLEDSHMDEYGSSLFNYRIYMRFAQPHEMLEITKAMVCNKDNKTALEYMKSQVIEARGVKRALINNILADASFIDDELAIQVDDISEDNIEQFEIYDSQMLDYFYKEFRNINDIIMDVLFQYCFWVFRYYEQNGVSNVEYDESAIVTLIPKSDKDLVEKLLDTDKRLKIIKRIVRKKIEYQNRKLSNYDSEGDEKITEEFNRLGKSSSLSLDKSADDFKDFEDTYWLVASFAIELGLSVDELTTLLIQRFYKTGELNTFDKNEGFLYFYNTYLNDKKIYALVEQLVRLWYEQILNNKVYCNFPIGGVGNWRADIFDADNQIIIEIKYYKSIGYISNSLVRTKERILGGIQTKQTTNSKRKVAIIVLSPEKIDNRIKDHNLEEDEIENCMIKTFLVCTRNYKMFHSMMQELENYLKE
ncbi:MAG: hypothetical protein IJ535_02255 [Pseudobutyrivibrio sp.]|uniref:P-loop NTPase fold protein n=1 Tax=Pseudobutyrivibrio sp. TaxID=2014367 RepID=UPI0025F5F593|nr:P-loop NTPase fold protein [Pseudobutyrivibrio sp.]MBQ8488582.1 hypothetical protein [Pseudobutyrivibrio sp.]